MPIKISLPVQLGIVIAAVLFFGSLAPMPVIELSYTFSVLFKELLGVLLPFMVFFFVISGILSFQRNAPLVLGILLAMIFFSNGLVALLTYGIMYLAHPIISCEPMGVEYVPAPSIHSLLPFSLTIPISSVHALMAAIVLGILLSMVRLSWVVAGINRIKGWIESVLTYGFIPLLPLYVLGFLLKMYHEGMLSCLFKQYGNAVILIIVVQIFYLIWMYLVATGFSFVRALQAMKNALPSYLAAFSTMSSTATVPVSIKAAQENIHNKGLAEMAMPIMANVHLLGDSISTPILAIVTMMVFQDAMPGFLQYAGFVFYFCATMFAVSGIPGGGILVMIPILISQLGFTAPMISVITTLYFLMDAFGTAANVMGDGALVMMVHTVLTKWGIIKERGK